MVEDHEDGKIMSWFQKIYDEVETYTSEQQQKILKDELCTIKFTGYDCSSIPLPTPSPVIDSVTPMTTGEEAEIQLTEDWPEDKQQKQQQQEKETNTKEETKDEL